MKIKILLFGVLAEEAGAERIELETGSDLDGLRSQVEKLYPPFSRYDYRLSVNRTLVQGNIALSDGDEVAFLPPFAGG
ncbi:MAG: MoaD/ThiS family protein [Bacteroidales bacterium]